MRSIFEQKVLESFDLERDDALVSRKIAALITGLSVSTLKRLEKSGRLIPERPTGPRGNVQYQLNEVLALITGGGGCR